MRNRGRLLILLSFNREKIMKKLSLFASLVPLLPAHGAGLI